jgi:hypothetical protein
MPSRLHILSALMLAIASCGSAALAATDADSSLAAAWSADATDTWGDYSQMSRHIKGTIWDEHAPASIYQWDTLSANESAIHWGSPKKWPVEQGEHFIHSGDWVMLDGWWDHGTYYQQRVTDERICDGHCGSCSPLEGNVQHYALWRVPHRPYCLQAEGIITEQSSGKVVHFKHIQAYGPPAPCSNKSFSHATCITQHEIWYDDNKSSFQKRLDRTSYLAKGLGPGFIVDQVFPKPWHGELHEPPQPVDR